MCEQTRTSDPSFRNEHFVGRDVRSTGIKGIRETESM